MLPLLIYYIVLPLLGFVAVLWLIRRYGADPVPRDVKDLYARRPIEKRFYRAVRRDPKGLILLADVETHDEAVDLIYRERERAAGQGEQASFLALDDTGAALDEVDS